MRCWCIYSSSILSVLFISLGIHGQGTGTNVPSDPLWPLFAELLSSQTGRTVQDINALGLSDPTISHMWTTYQSSMPKLDTPIQQATLTQQAAPTIPDLYQPSYSFSSQSTSQPTSGTGGDITQQLLSMLGSNTNAGSTSGSTGVSSVQDMLAAYQNMMSPGGSGQTSTSTSPSYNDLMSQYQAIMGQGSTGQTSASPSSTPSTNPASSLNDMMNTYAQMMGGLSGSSPLASNMNQLLQPVGGQSTPSASGSPSASTSPMDLAMQAYSQFMGSQTGGGGSSASTSPMDLAMQAYSQFMGSQTGGGGSSMLNNLMANYQNMMVGATNAQSNTNTLDQTQNIATPVDMGGSVSVNSGLTNNAVSKQQPQPSASTSSSSSFDQQLIQLFPQFKTAMQSSSSSSPPSSTATVTTPAPPAKSIPSSSQPSSSSSSGPQSTADISSTNSAQQIFDVLLFGQGGQPTDQTRKPASTPSNSNNNNPQAGAEAGANMKQYVMEQQKQSPGNLLSAHMKNVWKARASRDMGCRFLPELFDLDVFPGVPLDCRNKCPFPYVNAQQFGVYCMCCPPGVNDQIVSMVSLLRRPAFLKDNPLRVMT